MSFNTLAPVVRAGLLDEVLDGLGFIHANDHCRRNCLHCPAFGDQSPVIMTPFATLTKVVSDVGDAYRERGRSPRRSIASWRISDPLDYLVRSGSGIRDTYDVGVLWRRYLDQGIYLVTNGSEGKRQAREALRRLAGDPEVASQIKLTITPCDQGWGTDRYLDNIAQDIAILAPLWDLGSTRMEDPQGRRFRINLKSTAERRDESLEFLEHALVVAGVARAKVESLMEDSTHVAVKDIYDLGSYAGDSPVKQAINIKGDSGRRFKPTAEARTQYQYGIYPDGTIQMIDMYEFQVYPVALGGEPLRLNVDGAADGRTRRAS
ncbi:hypothetical protein [Pilimelia columellifera]|uniref:Radical SAM protein n=1 Tax=Pilimelia columellifera subsp. columellifera TaxID=706583 RepID=A0ABP6B4B3_9ACTN